MKLFWRWKKDGENDQATFNDDYYQKCAAFSREIKKTRAEYLANCLTRMERLGLKQFKPLHWKYEQLSALQTPGQHKHKKRRSQRHENRNRSETI